VRLNSDLNLHFSDRSILKYLYTPVQYLNVIANIRELFTNYKRIDILVFAGLGELRKYLGHPVPAWVIAANLDNAILILDYELWKMRKYGNINQIIIHEMVHVILGNYKVPVPLWLNEGLAQYLAGQLDERVMQRKPPGAQSVYELNYHHEGLYSLSGRIVQKLIARYGLQTVISRLPQVADYRRDALFGAANVDDLIHDKANH
jgi:hypothetical protein